MKKRLKEFALIAEIVSGIAVVVTLVVLILSVQRNTEITRAMMFADLQNSGELEAMALADPELNEIYEAYLGMRTSELSEQQKRRVARIVVISASRYDAAYTLRNAGLLGINEWERRSRNLCTSYDRAISAGVEDIFFGLMSIDLQDYVEATCVG